LAFLYYDQVDVLINNSGILATEASISSSNTIKPVYILGRKNSLGQIPNGPVKSTIGLSYIAETFNDHGYNRVNFLKTGHFDFDYPGDTIVIGGLTGNGYLSSYGFSVSPNQPIEISASYECFVDISGTPASKSPLTKYNTSSGSGIPYGMTCFIFTSGNYNIVPTYSFKYSFKADFQPVYALGAKAPIQMQYLGAEETFVLVRDAYTGLQFSGQFATGYFNSTGNTDIDLIGLGYLNSDTRYMMNFNISGAQVVNHSLSVGNQDFVKIETTAKNFF
jgi:hypothetical protein